MNTVVSIVLNNFKNDSRVLKENLSLKKAGYTPTVIALHEEPLKEYDNCNEITIHRVKLRTRKLSKHPLIQWIKFIEFSFIVARKYGKNDVFHCNDLKALPVGAVIKTFINRKAKIIYDAHEYETELNGLKGIQKRLIKWLERRLIKYADRVITVSDSIAEEYARLYSIQKPALVLNTPPLYQIAKRNLFREALGIKDQQIIFLYQGGLTPGRGIEVLLETFESMENNSAIIVFMGYGPLEEKIKISQTRSTNVFFHAAVSPDVLLDYTASADFGISTIEDTCLSYRYCLPNKMFEYLMSDIPIIVSNLPEMSKVVESSKVGVVAFENTPDGLREAINQSLKLDREKIVENIQHIKSKYSWEEQEKVLIEVYSSLYAN